MRRFQCPALLIHGAAILRRTYGTPAIPQIILDQLKQADDIGRDDHASQSPSPIHPQPSYKSKQIFLLPGQIINNQKQFAAAIDANQTRISPSADALERLIPLEFDDTKDTMGSSDTRDHNTTVIANIERFKPPQKQLSKTGYTAVEARIMRAFTKSQLVEYLKQRSSSPQFVSLSRSLRTNKKAIVSRIMLEIWGTVCLDELTNAHDLLTHESVPLKDRDVFLLLSHQAHVLQYVARGGAKLSLVARDQGSHREAQLKLKGTASQVHTAQVNIMSILGKATHTRMDLSLLMRLFKEKQEPYELHMVGRHTEMYFEPIGPDIYDLLSLSVGQVKRCKRLLLWMLDYVQHRRESLLIVGLGQFTPYVNDDALQWTMRGKAWNILRARTILSHNELLQADLARFSDEKMQDRPEDYMLEIAHAKGRHNLNSSPRISRSDDFDIMRVLQDTADQKDVQDFGFLKEQLSLEIEELDLFQEISEKPESQHREKMEEFDLLRELSETNEPNSHETVQMLEASHKETDAVSESISSEETDEPRIIHDLHCAVDRKIDAERELSTPGTEANKVPAPEIASELATRVAKPSALTSQQIDTIYSELVDFGYRSHLNGVTDDKLNSPIFTATIGNVLYEATENDTDSPHDNSVYKFTSNVALANDKVLSLPLYDEPVSDVAPVEQNRGQDPHTYALQIKFMPSPFPNEVVGDMKSEDQIQYPPVEMWIELNTHAKADIDTLVLVLVEGENNYHLSLADRKADLKVCCQLSGDLLRSDEREIEKEATLDTSDLESILMGTSQRYSRFDSQPGIAKFLEALTLDFSGKTAAIIEAHIDLIISGKTVRYHHISTLYRRQINFSYGSEDLKERMVQLNIVEGGALGGRRTEINLVGDVHGDISREEFGRLMLDSQLFVAEL